MSKRRKTPQSASRTPQPNTLPPVFRIRSIVRLPFGRGHVLTRASLFHDRKELTVEWVAPHSDPRLSVDTLVSVCLDGPLSDGGGTVRIAKLVAQEPLVRAPDLFETIPPNWVRDRALVARASHLWQELTPGLQRLFNAIFWDGRRFHRYVVCPETEYSDDMEVNGNLRHSVEVAERARGLAESNERLYGPVIIMAALLHNAGMAENFRLIAHRCERADRSILEYRLGYRPVVFDWIARAWTERNLWLLEPEYLSLVHMLSWTKERPPMPIVRDADWLDATVLSAPGYGRYQRDCQLDNAQAVRAHPGANTAVGGEQSVPHPAGY